MSEMVDTVDILESLSMIKDGMNVLDIGCSKGNWADTIIKKGYDVNYLGLDVSMPRIAICEERFKGASCKFKHLDIFNTTYNPLGSMSASQATLPVNSAWADLIICHSLFTHLGKFSNARQYMNEIIRIAKPGSHLWITFFQSPPNEPSSKTARSVYTALEVERLVRTFTKLYCNGGETTDYNDQVMMAFKL